MYSVSLPFTVFTAHPLRCKIYLGGWSERTLPLANVLLTPWALFQGASEEVIARAKDDGDDDLLIQGGTALEVCRPSFKLSALTLMGRWRLSVVRNVSSVVHLVKRSSVSLPGRSAYSRAHSHPEAIWSGRIIYSALNTHALIADVSKAHPPNTDMLSELQKEADSEL